MCAIGPAVVAQDLRAISIPGVARLGDIAVLVSLGLPVVPLLGLLRLADQLLPSPLEPRPPQRLKTLLSQALVLVAIELFLLLAGLGLIQFLKDRRASQHNPNGLNCNSWSPSPDRWSRPLHSGAVFAAAGSSPLQSPSSHRPESTSCSTQQLEDARRFRFAAGYQCARSVGSNPRTVAELAL